MEFKWGLLVWFHGVCYQDTLKYYHLITVVTWYYIYLDVIRKWESLPNSVFGYKCLEVYKFIPRRKKNCKINTTTTSTITTDIIVFYNEFG